MFRKGPIGDDIGRARDAASARSPAWGEKTVAAVAARTEARERAAAAEASRIWAALAPVRSAQSEIVNARMTDAGASAHAAARTGARATVVAHEAIAVGADGAERLERSAVTALFSANSCAVFRLAAKGAIEETGVKAALAFALAGDMVLGAFRVRTVDYERVPVKGGRSLVEAQSVAVAVERWRAAIEELTRAEFAVLDGVMRRDLSSEAAAREAFPAEKGDKKLRGMGDASLISACHRLAREYGFRARNEARRA